MKNIKWLIDIGLPYNVNWSKNKSHRMCFSKKHGRTILYRSSETAYLMEALSLEIKSLYRGQIPPRAKVWVDISIIRPDYKTDPHNFWDNLADSIKHGIGIDDRYFAIYRLDWVLKKEPPHEIRIRIGI